MPARRFPPPWTAEETHACFIVRDAMTRARCWRAVVGRVELLRMANDDHISQLKKGAGAWNEWRHENPSVRVINLSGADLQGADLSGANLREADLREANLEGANLTGADLIKACLHVAVLIGANLSGADLIDANLHAARLKGADLTGANITGANLRGAQLIEAKLSEAKLSEGLSEADLSEAKLCEADLGNANLEGANLTGADLTRANLSEANLSEADLTGASLSEAILSDANLRNAKLTNANLSAGLLDGALLLGTDLTDTDLTGCRIYGVSAWNLKLEGAKQHNLIITPENEHAITVDDIEVAQFIYLMLHNEKIRNVIDTITSKAVLILGRFTDGRKQVLNALREDLRGRNYLPILFDFDKPTSQTTDETITLLARMSRFVIADISDAKSVLQELRAIVPDLPSVPVQPIILAMQEEPGMFDFYRNFRSFLNVHRYASQEQLIADLGEKVIRPAELKVLDLRGST